MTSRAHRRLVSLAVILVASACPIGGSGGVSAQPRGGAFGEPLDGIAAIVGASGDEAAATVLLDSDVALRSALCDLLAGRAAGTPSGAPGSASAALRRTVLVSFLARQALAAGEEGDASERQAIVDRAAAVAGGSESLAALLSRWGATEAELLAWAGDVALAARQVEALRERLEPPTDREILQRFERGDHPFVGLDARDARSVLRGFIVDERLRATIAEELAAAIESRAIRIFR